jgi:hypothetical protein
MPDWSTAGEAGDFGTLLLELFAYMGDVLHFYIDRAAGESFLSTAQRRQSILYIADMLGYTPIGQQAATVTLEFTLDYTKLINVDPATYTVTIPARTQVRTSDNGSGNAYTFEVDSDVTLGPLTTGTTVTAVATATEGVSVSNRPLGFSKGYPNWSIPIDTGVIFGTLTVYSREGGRLIDWTYVDDIAAATPTQSVFTSYVDDSDVTHILFGDNASGRIPPINTDLFVSYRTGKGAAANSLPIGAVTSIAPVVGVDLAGVTVTSTDVPVGGSDIESIESMRYSIPTAAGRLKKRAITLSDYSDLALQVPGVAKAVAYGTIYSVIFVRVAPVGGNASDDYMDRICTGVEHFLADKILVGTTVVAEPRSFADLWTDVWVRVNLHVESTYNRTKVKTDVETALKALFAFDNVDFDYKITIGQVYRKILAIPGVEWADVFWLDTAAPSNTAVEVDIFQRDDNRSITNVIPTTRTILRLSADEVVEPEVSFPTLTLAERTHNGLWVQAVGGMPNT